MTMDEYQKINSVFKRDERGRFIEGDWACPEFGYLADLRWRWTEKVDGTNVRVHFSQAVGVRFGGRTDNAQMPTFLFDKLGELFHAEQLIEVFRDSPDVTLYGEGYGAKIQKGGGNYNPIGCDFILFDVKVGPWWLLPDAVTDIAVKLNLEEVPLVGEFSLTDAIESIRENDIPSAWHHAQLEGLVGKPAVQLFNRMGERIVTKVKVRDFR